MQLIQNIDLYVATLAVARQLLISLPEDGQMLYYSLIFLLVAIVCAVLGFGVLAAAAAGIAKILFFVFLVVFLVSLIMGRRAVL